MKICCVCCTYLRAHLLGHLIRCFLEQDYPAADRELVILDDAGEYRPQRGDGWQLVSIDRRFRSLAEKRNAACGLAAAGTEAFAVWDDDDYYLPWALSAVAWALQRGGLARPSQVLYEEPMGAPKVLQRRQTGGLYHGSWAYTAEAFDLVGGYRHGDSNGEDQHLAGRMTARGIQTVDPLAGGFDPYYIYHSEANASYRMSWQPFGAAGWDQLGQRRHDGLKDQLAIGWPYDLRTIPIETEVLPRPF